MLLLLNLWHIPCVLVELNLRENMEFHLERAHVMSDQPLP